MTVVESHYLLGGAAHSFEVKGFKFDAGPSFHAGLSTPNSPNPLKQVLDIIGERVPCATYDRWLTYYPNGTYPTRIGADAYRAGAAYCAALHLHLSTQAPQFPPLSHPRVIVDPYP